MIPNMFRFLVALAFKTPSPFDSLFSFVVEDFRLLLVFGERPPTHHVLDHYLLNNHPDLVPAWFMGFKNLDVFWGVPFWSGKGLN